MKRKRTQREDKKATLLWMDTGSKYRKNVEGVRSYHVTISFVRSGNDLFSPLAIFFARFCFGLQLQFGNEKWM